MKNRIYLDHAATTAMLPEVGEAMASYLGEAFGNPSGVYATGREAHKALDLGRKQAAEALGASPREIYFTSGGSESDNWAIIGTAMASREKGRHIITSAIEHHAVLRPCQYLEKLGYEVTYLPVDALGRISPDDLEQAIRPDTILISLMAANNEIGTIQPVAAFGEISKAHGIPFHTDAVQAMGAMPINVKDWQTDMLSLSAHKFHGPKGMGLLYIRMGTRVDPLIHGGAQERGLRAGTENTAGIAGMGRAMDIAAGNIPERTAKIRALRDRLSRALKESIPEMKENGDPGNRLPGHIHFSIPGVDGEALLLRLDLAGIAVSSGSACTSGSTEPSHVLEAIGLSKEEAKSSIRITVGEENTEDEIDETARTLTEIVQDLRRMRGL